MKKIVVSTLIAASLVLTACGGATPTNDDWDLNRSTSYNNQTYCQNGVYNPLPNNTYSCTIGGKTSTPTKRPKAIIPATNKPKPPSTVKKDTKTQPKPKAPAKKSTTKTSKK